METGGLDLVLVQKSDPELQERMAIHYSKPKSFVARTLCYVIDYDGVYYGHKLVLCKKLDNLNV